MEGYVFSSNDSAVFLKIFTCGMSTGAYPLHLLMFASSLYDIRSVSRMFG